MDLYDEEDMLGEIDPDTLVIEDGDDKDEQPEAPQQKKMGKKARLAAEAKRAEELEGEFAKDYKKMGGI